MPGIYVVDDDHDMVFMIKLALEKNSYVVTPFRNGNEALKAVRINAPDLMIVDLSMPEMDGWRLCMKVREEEKCKDLPIIVLSGLVAEEESNASPNDPYNILMAKPFEIPRLMNNVKTLLGEKQ
jgi:CheY-like chemotaxis protein